MNHILSIGQSNNFNQQIQHAVEQGYAISFCETMDSARDLLDNNIFTAVLIGDGLSHDEGFELCKKLKSDTAFQNLVIIFLTEKLNAQHLKEAFLIGADDYLKPPFTTVELTARIQARTRQKISEFKTKSYSFTFGPLRFDSIKQRAYLKQFDSEKDLNLTPLEFRILFFLAENAGLPFDRFTLMKTVMENSMQIRDDNIYTHISSIRKKLGEYNHLLESVHRAGYRMVNNLNKSISLTPISDSI